MLINRAQIRLNLRSWTPMLGFSQHKVATLFTVVHLIPSISMKSGQYQKRICPLYNYNLANLVFGLIISTFLSICQFPKFLATYRTTYATTNGAHTHTDSGSR